MNYRAHHKRRFNTAYSLFITTKYNMFSPIDRLGKNANGITLVRQSVEKGRITDMKVKIDFSLQMNSTNVLIAIALRMRLNLV